MKFAALRTSKGIQRPPAVTWLAGLVFLLGMANLSIVVTGFTRRSVLGMLTLSVSLPVLIVLGGLWAVLWIGAAWGLFRLQKWSRKMTPILFTIYEIITLGKQALFSQEAYSRDRLVFAGVMGGLLLGLVAVVLNHPTVRKAFQRDETTTSPQT